METANLTACSASVHFLLDGRSLGEPMRCEFAAGATPCCFVGMFQSGACVELHDC
jgi:hypothetical protein